MSGRAASPSSLGSLLRDLEQVAAIEAELAATSEAHELLHRTVKAAQTAFDQSLFRRQQLILRRDAILEDIRLRKCLTCPISALPDDVVREIFLQLVNAYEMPRLASHLHLSWTRLSLPGNLSVVCRQWNRVARCTPLLWSYIGLDVCEDGRRYHNGGPVAFLEHMLQRSGVARLDVVIDALHGYAARQAAKKSTSERRRVLRSIFDRLASERHRIRTFHLCGRTLDMASGDSADPDCGLENLQELTLGLFRLSTPAMEEIRVEFEETSYVDYRDRRPWAPYPDRPLPLYLPDAPRLKRLALKYLPLMCTGSLHPGLPGLKVLHVQNLYFYQEHIWEMLALCPLLDELVVESPEGCDSAVDLDVLLPLSISVTSVAISTGDDEGIFNGGIQFPNLTALRLPNFNSCPRFFTNIADTLTSLTITSGLLDAADILAYKPLQKVEHVAIGTERCDHSALLEAMIHDTDPMWPCLRSVEFGVLYADDTNGRALGEWMLDLVQERKARASRDSNVRALERLVFDQDAAASWVVISLRDILGEKHVIVIE